MSRVSNTLAAVATPKGAVAKQEAAKAFRRANPKPALKDPFVVTETHGVRTVIKTTPTPPNAPAMLDALKEAGKRLVADHERLVGHADPRNTQIKVTKANVSVVPTPKATPPTAVNKGRKSIADMPQAERKAEVAELIDDLKASTDPDEKKRIRRALRARGHMGGLGVKAVAKPAVVTKQAAVTA